VYIYECTENEHSVSLESDKLTAIFEMRLRQVATIRGKAHKKKRRPGPPARSTPEKASELFQCVHPSPDEGHFVIKSDLHQYGKEYFGKLSAYDSVNSFLSRPGDVFQAATVLLRGNKRLRLPCFIFTRQDDPIGTNESRSRLLASAEMSRML
jgi:hypothetical protein